MLARCRNIEAVRVRGRIEALPFEARRFDLVTCAWRMETSADPGAVLREYMRVTRPGGYFYPIDFRERPDEGPAYAQYRTWWDHRWNTEVWSREFRSLDLAKEMEKVGFTMKKDAKAVLRGFGVRHGIKQS